MGTLGNQPARGGHLVDDSYLDDFLQKATMLAKKHKILVDTVIEARHVLEIERANNLRVSAGDYHDEHMGGLGEILNRIASALEHLHA